MCPAVLSTFASKLGMKLGCEFHCDAKLSIHVLKRSFFFLEVNCDAKLSIHVLKRSFFFLEVLAIGENATKGGM
jgi:hypothetical protein